MSSPLAQLLPISTFKLGFTTFSLSPASLAELNVISVPLADSSLGVHKITRSLTHEVVRPPPSIHPSSNDPRLAWESKYPKGSCSPKTDIPGGLGFYFGGPKEFAASLQEGAKEAVFGYRVMFEKGWEWVKGGKLPGMYGGVGDAAYRCSGGRQNDRCKCFDVRLMWRRDGKGEIYTYLPMNETNTNALLAVPPYSKVNPDHGISIGNGAWIFEPGVWTTIAERVKLNDIGRADGELQLWINGVCVIHAKGLIFREDETSNIKGMHFQTFFGGHESDWASPKDQRAWFSDVSGAIIR
ncbi:polysaccharide lyase family 14 protein [Suillus ampliporus]|nr:polysaccharide lyase family 14 protein [Suillus ampliporus]